MSFPPPNRCAGSGAGAGGARGGLRRSGKCVLYVDDEEALAAVGKLMLEHLGHAVEIHLQPARALRAMENAPERYDLALIDLTMPGMSGVQLAQALLAIRPDLPVALLTGHAATLTPDQVRGLGLRELILKPVSLQALALLVARCLTEMPVTTRGVPCPEY